MISQCAFFVEEANLDTSKSFVGPSGHWKQSVTTKQRNQEIQSYAHTSQRSAKIRLRIKVLAMLNHDTSQVSNWERLFLVVTFRSLGDDLDVSGH
jgi:hypothetical protein